jgi:hypothetical protein
VNCTGKGIVAIAYREPAWRRIGAWALGALGLGTVVLVVSRFGELEHFIEIERGAKPIWLVAAFPLQALTYAAAAAVWYCALHRAGSHRPLATLLPLGIAKLFADQVIPSGGLSGTLLVMAGLARRGIPRPLSMAVLLVGLVSYYTAYLLATAAALVVLGILHVISPALIGIAVVFVAVAVAILASTLWLRRSHGRRLHALLTRVPGVAGLVSAVSDAPTYLMRNPSLMSVTTALQLSVFMLDAATLYVMLRAVGVTASPMGVFASFMVASVTATVGPMPLGLGTFEGALVATLHLVGVQLEAAFAATFLLRGLTFWLPMLPGLWLTRRELQHA